MENPIVSWLFETDAVRVCPEGQPFWYTSGKLGPFYINTQFLYGSEEAANALLTVIEQACAGDKLRFYDKVYGEIEKQLAACPIYRQLIDLMTEAARKMDVDFVSGGERRDFFFSMPVARKLGLGHLSIFKDLSSVYTDANGVSMPAGQASLSGQTQRAYRRSGDSRFFLYPRMDSRRGRVGREDRLFAGRRRSRSGRQQDSRRRGLPADDAGRHQAGAV